MIKLLTAIARDHSAMGKGAMPGADHHAGHDMPAAAAPPPTSAAIHQN